MDLASKHVAVVGLGQTGLATLAFLQGKCARLQAFDTRNQLSIPPQFECQLGELDEQKLAEADLILLSPGLSLKLPAIQAAIAAGVEVIGDIELLARLSKKPVIAITGSNGKSTVTELTTLMLQQAGINARMGGNIGVPVLELVDSEAEVLVLELSSFQLETTSSMAPLAATVLNVSEDHLDRYRDFDEYRDAKLTIYRGAQHAVTNRHDSNTQAPNGTTAISFGLDSAEQGFGFDPERDMITLNGDDWLRFGDCQLRGIHNVLNIQAAAALALLAGAQNEAVKQAAKGYAGLPHRCALVAEHQGVRWINDSKATNVGATLAALQGFQAQGAVILLAGGDGKGADFSELAAPVKQLKALITLGKNGPDIAALRADSIQVRSLRQAVEQAAALAKSGDIVLLSPACASLDMFANYQDRGNQFVAAVKEITCLK